MRLRSASTLQLRLAAGLLHAGIDQARNGADLAQDAEAEGLGRVVVGAGDLHVQRRGLRRNSGSGW